MAAAPERTKVFISYSHKDRKWLERLQVHLKPLEREGIVDRWDDTRIKGGQKWREEIERALASAKVAVLLISADFLASDFIVENELPPLLEAAVRDGLVVLPVILSPSRFSHKEALSQFQTMNAPSRPLLDLSPADQEKIWVNLTERIERVLQVDAQSDSRVIDAPNFAENKVGEITNPRHQGEMPEEGEDFRGVGSLIVALNAPDSSVRESAALALGRLGDSRAVPYLIAVLTKGWNSKYVRKSAALALGRLGDISALKPLAATLNKLDMEERSVGWAVVYRSMLILLIKRAYLTIKNLLFD